jgi:hypothetical protein
VEKIRNRGRVWRYRGQASLYQLTSEGAVALAGIAVSPRHARRWSRCARTFFRISHNDIDKSAWLSPS